MIQFAKNNKYNYADLPNGMTVVWDNVAIFNSFSPESKTLADILNDRLSINSPDQLAHLKTLLELGLIKKSESKLKPISDSKKEPRPHMLIHERFSVLLKFFNDDFSWHEANEKIKNRVPLSNRTHLIFTDDFLSPLVTKIVSKNTRKRFILINIFSANIVVSPLIETTEECRKLQRALSKTWSAAIFSGTLSSYWPAEIIEHHFNDFIYSFSKFVSNERGYNQKKYMLSFDQKKKFRKHQVIFELSESLQPLSLSQIKKKFLKKINVRDRRGGNREYPIHSTYRLIKKYVDPVTGLADLVEETQLNGIYIFRGVSRLQYLLKGKYSNLYSLGKGHTRNHSYVSCVAEFIERAQSFTFAHHRKTAKTSQLGKRKKVTPDKILHFSESQYKNRNEDEKNFFKRVPAPIKGKDLNWVKVLNLTNLTYEWIPQEYCYHPINSRSKHFIPTSNGIAAGRTYPEAILQGLFELVERDCAAIWWYNQCYRKQINLSLLKLPIVIKADKYLKSVNRTLRVIEITSDLGIPCYVAISYENVVSGSLLLGLGCHPRNSIAVGRAVTELLQSEAVKTKNSNGPKAEYSKFFPQQSYDLTFLNPGSSIELPLDEVKNEPKSVQEMVAYLKAFNLELYVLDFSTRNHFMKVLRVIVPGLRNIALELAPGRLTEVPVKLGLQAKEKIELELNPICLDI